jgi:TRAP-type C4-dicarboxylate transport system permease small subunit
VTRAAMRALAWAQLAVASLLFVAAMTLYAAEIVMRGFLNTGYPDYYEVVGIAFIYVFLLGAAALYARNEDIVIDLVYDRLPLSARPWLVLAVYVGIVATMTVVLVHTASIVFTSLVEALGCLIWIGSGTRPRTWPRGFFDQQPAEEERI